MKRNLFLRYEKTRSLVRNCWLIVILQIISLLITRIIFERNHFELQLTELAKHEFDHIQQ